MASVQGLTSLSAARPAQRISRSRAPVRAMAAFTPRDAVPAAGMAAALSLVAAAPAHAASAVIGDLADLVTLIESSKGCLLVGGTGVAIGVAYTLYEK